MLTKKELLELWKRYDFRPNKRLGQNFLIDKNLKDKLIKCINPKTSDIILEIGAGFGELTLDLADSSRGIVALEKDERIVNILRSEILKNSKNIELIEKDFLKYDFKMEFDKIVGNIPYYITTRIIERVLELGPSFADDVFIMVQSEYANRMCAGPGTKEYSSLSCFIQLGAEIKKIMSINKHCFFPVPKFDSSFIKLNFLKSPKVRVRNKRFFNDIIRYAFQQRRKTFINAVSPKIKKDKNELIDILETLGIDKNVRPEDLSLEEFGKLADRLT